MVLFSLTARVGASPRVVQAQSTSLPAQINKSFSPISIIAGGNSQLSITIFNPNAFQLINASWTDSLPAGITIANPANISTTCGGDVTAVAGGTSIQLTSGTMPAQSGATPGSCTVAVDITSTTPGNLINTIPAGALTSTSPTDVPVTNTTPASATLQVGVVQPPSLNKNFSLNTIWAGETSVLTINLVNNDLANALSAVRLTDTLPVGITLANPVSSTLTNCGGATLTAVSGAGTLSLENATIAASATCSIQVRVTATSQGTYTNTIPAGAIQSRQGVTNAAAASANLAVQSIGLIKDFQAISILQGGSTLLTITLRNPSGAPYTGVHFTDTLPGTLVIANSPAPVNNCGGTLTAAAGTNLIELTNGTVPASSNPPVPSTCTIVVPVTAPPNAPVNTLTNTIPVGNMTTAEGISNPSPASDTLNIAAVLTVSKSFSPTTITVGSPSTVTITLRNYTAAALTGVTCNDTSALTSTQYCYYEGPTAAYPRGRIVWNGALGPDFGALDAETAANEIAISFTVRVSSGVTDVPNTAYANADTNGDGDVADPGEQQAASASEDWKRPVSTVKQLPETGFHPGAVSVLPAQPANLLYTSQAMRLEIPQLGVDLPVVGVPQSGAGWDVTWLGNSAGWLNGTAYPTWNGNSVLTGHVWDALNHPGPFAQVKSLKYDDQIRIHAFGQVYIYQVRENRLVLPEQANAVLKHEEKPWITLLTCENFNELFDAYANRRMVRAVLVRVEPEK